ncbi:MAG: hypothetical protein JWN56_3048 [Sphingobacteriales bacterium]|nr:hypothetical protein [Sphingobacteriales bacterium]
MKQILSFLAFLFLSGTLFCQTFKTSGIITDGSKQPIVFATVSVPSKGLFFPTNLKGEFSITSNEVSLLDTIFFSCIGFKTIKVEANKLVGSNKSIVLKQHILELAEVTVSNKKTVIIKVGSKLNSYFATSHGLPGKETAMFMQGSANINGYIMSVAFFLREGNVFSKMKGDATAPFRVRIFERNKITGAPGKELINDVIITSSPKKNHWHTIDLSNYEVNNPEYGFFVCFSLLSQDYYTRLNDFYYKKFGYTEQWQIPYLTASQFEFKEDLSYSRSPTYNDWRKEIDRSHHFNYLIRATIQAL